ncbi:BLUF domain-containing protein [uncultured Marinobacter sp.]|uniref:BLUF domain-containing protein n=1 Tax=uncultured Marinobacter sp. TaxID=187379 RepID=UPI00262A22D8|nr:BLUF domain-containing protein [uncultured Marinobacter sp.]
MSDEVVENDLIHCIYCSAGTVRFSDTDMVSLLEKAREANAALGVTGMLLYEAGSFFQVLEGPAESVDALYEKIFRDKRHRRITKIIREPIEARNFSEWTMGYAGVTRQDLKEIEGLNDFFYAGKCFTELDPGRAKKLLETFKDGNWRASLR